MIAGTDLIETGEILTRETASTEIAGTTSTGIAGTTSTGIGGMVSTVTDVTAVSNEGTASTEKEETEALTETVVTDLTGTGATVMTGIDVTALTGIAETGTIAGMTDEETLTEGLQSAMVKEVYYKSSRLTVEFNFVLLLRPQRKAKAPAGQTQRTINRRREQTVSSFNFRGCKTRRHHKKGERN